MSTIGVDDRDALYGALRDHHLRIGDSQYYVPPTAITVTKRMKNEKVNVLRSRSSMVKSAGHFDHIIELNLFFPGLQSINNELRPLLAQVRKCPFLPVTNMLLNDTYQVEAVTISSISVQTVDGFPGCLMAQVQMYAFNPFSYIFDQSERSYEEMFNWPLFRWHYRRSLEPNPKRNLVFYEPLQIDLHNEYMFRIAAEEDLEAMKDWKDKRDKLIKLWMDDKTDKAGFDEEDWTWIGGIFPVPKPLGKDEDGVPHGFYDEAKQVMFDSEIDKMYGDDIYKLLQTNEFRMDNWDIPGLYLQELSVGYQNIITPTQIQMHESPTHQYLGSQDAVYVARFKADDPEALGSLENLVRRSTYLNREYHSVLSNGFIEFDHQLTRLFGCTYVVIEDMVSSTVEGQPGVHEITLTLSAFNRAAKRLEETQMLYDSANNKTIPFELSNYAWWNPFDDPASRDWLQFAGLADWTSDQDFQKRAIYESKVKELMKNVELYPDLELPTYKEVADAGFVIPNLNNGVYVDPDFFLIYNDPIDYGEELDQYMNANSTTPSEWRDSMNGSASVVPGSVEPGQVVTDDIAAKQQTTPSPVASTQTPSSVDTVNLSVQDIETLIRKKSQDVANAQSDNTVSRVDQVLMLALAKTFDPQMRQFYTVGPGANKELGNIEVTTASVPILQMHDLRYFKDENFIREASFIGVMRVSPLMGDPNSLARNIEYNVEQGCKLMQHYLDIVAGVNLVGDNIYTTFGLTSTQKQKAIWVGAIAMYLGYEREYNLLLNSNKKMPYLIVNLIKTVLSKVDKIGRWTEAQLTEKYSTLPVADYKTASATSDTAQFQESNLTEEDYADMDVTFRESFHDMRKYDRRGRLVRAFPTFLLFFIDEGQFVAATKMSDNYFNYRAVMDIMYTNSRKTASSTLVLEMSNVFGSLDDAAKSFDLTNTNGWDIVQLMFNPASLAREAEKARRGRNPNWYNSIYLRTGARVHFRMGYGSNAINMPTMMNGVITQLQNNGETITAVCQDDGIELTHKLKASPGDTTRGWVFSKKEPTEILDEILTDHTGFWGDLKTQFSNADYQQHSLGIMHFGMPGPPVSHLAINFNGAFEDRQRNEITQNIYKTTGLLRFQENSFWNKLGNFFGIGKGDEDGINISLYDKTVWDVLNICAAVGEDFIVAVHPYDFRNTIFMGKPYFPIAYAYDVAGGKSMQDTNLASYDIQAVSKPFRQYHIYDSWTSIVENQIIATTENMYTVAVGVYSNEGNLDTTQAIYVDTNIWPEMQRTVQIDTQLNAQGIRLIENIPIIGHFLNKLPKWYFDEWTAIKIAAAGLRDYVKQMYDGYLTVMGDPSVKPYDICYFNDTFNNMSGPIEVREVNHLLNFETGYITMIKPDAVVVNSDRHVMTMLQGLTHTAAYMIMSYTLRAVLRNMGYKGAFPVMNAIWSVVKRRYEAMKGKFDATKVGSKLMEWTTAAGEELSKPRTIETKNYRVEIDPVTKEVRRYDPVTDEMKNRWTKSGILKDMASKIENFTEKDAQALFDNLYEALYDKRFKGYNKIDAAKLAKLKTGASKMMATGFKVTAKAGRWGKRGWEMATGALAIFGGPVGIAAYLIETAVVEIACACISEFIERFLFTRKSCIIAVLRRDGIEFSAGINGHMGSVIGDSPDFWQRFLTNDVVGGVLAGFLGADTSQYAPIASDDDLSMQASGSSVDFSQFASSFFEKHRYKVIADTQAAEVYNFEVGEATKQLQGQVARQEADFNRKPTYEEDRTLLTSDDLTSSLGGSDSSGGSGYAAGTSFDTMDLNQPSGISADAIDAAFEGTGLAGLGKYFKQLEISIPSAPSPLALQGDGAGSARVMSGLYLAAHAAWETGWGTSRIFKDKNNLFGYGAVDSNPYDGAYTFATPQDCIYYAANKIKTNYLTAGGKYYNGSTLVGMNIKYASDKNWHNGIAQIMAKIAKHDPNFLPPTPDAPKASSGTNGTSAEVPTTTGSAGMKQYSLTPEQAKSVLVSTTKVTSVNFYEPIMQAPLIRQASADLLQQLGAVYTAKSGGKKLMVTSTYRKPDGSLSWHNTGFAVDIDTPDMKVVAGKLRFTNSADRDMVEMVIDLAVQAGFDGILHADDDLLNQMRKKYPKNTFTTRADHYNHVHLHYPTK
ncbi:Mannosyl-glycoprotein endo-beta-N-acetylglucosaminidase [Paenibacillus sp. UNC496MF]|uniref:glucosaminidase domain-containing protein n=1 Tax=Paenibacillus sp. UNC496MF TaxID=1502753 RepID=UPI0008E909C0|nr:glucosaminidase domain-containing protein [Paenibacillus sp. UNC496MF]SFJ66079.1 Mannosyl-glycoprotein endo-beta-N-acetylglucosaminidase [Paenibacillus sp. UNC496MF]